uniref:Uncharacterized protein n=1 Tax=Ascaris lumbricoides TaxID=6252 RepID=A0A0M3HTA7_ASCLU
MYYTLAIRICYLTTHPEPVLRKFNLRSRIKDGERRSAGDGIDDATYRENLETETAGGWGRYHGPLKFSARYYRSTLKKTEDENLKSKCNGNGMKRAMEGL